MKEKIIGAIIVFVVVMILAIVLEKTNGLDYYSFLLGSGFASALCIIKEIKE